MRSLKIYTATDELIRSTATNMRRHSRQSPPPPPSRRLGKMRFGARPVGSISEHDLTWLKDHSHVSSAKIDVYAYVNNLHPVELFAKPKGLI